MNAYYEHARFNNSHRAGISVPATHIGDKLISAICLIVAFFTSSIAIKIEKTVFCAICFFGFFGVVGSIESASVSPFVGILLCAVFCAFEYLTLKSLFAKKKQ